MSWISTSESLPKDKEYVLVSFVESKHDAPRHCEVAQFIKGLSLSERKEMRDGGIPDPDVKFFSPIGAFTDKRSNQFYEQDEGYEHPAYGGTYKNAYPYAWDIHNGQQTFFGQAVSHWQPLTKPL